MSGIACRGVRGATTVAANDRELILARTRELLALMIRLNGIDAADVASAVFTATADLDAEYPALAARQLGWHDVALLCGRELDIPGGLPRCVRVLLHWNTPRPAAEIQHVYIEGAVNLRPDRNALPAVDWTTLEGWIAEQLAAWTLRKQG